ncbi:MAG: hypothetical protein LQ341_001566 [Variospora aurantia]|nr:MAG: hypothetical protein LQ341_001566 [Variospora aurantia]
MALTPYAADPIRRAAESIVIIHSDDIRTQQSVNNPTTEQWQLEHTFGYALYFLRHARSLVDAYHFRGLLDSVNNFARRGSGAQLVRRELSILFQEANQYALYEEFLDRFMPHWQRAMRRRQMEEEQGMGRGHHAPAGHR